MSNYKRQKLFDEPNWEIVNKNLIPVEQPASETQMTDRATVVEKLELAHQNISVIDGSDDLTLALNVQVPMSPMAA